jgi:Cu-Zn family superoxide dismutase
VKNEGEETVVNFSTDQWCIGCGDETKDILGKGIIVHQGVDDFTSQPSGAAGSRVSCGGIIE